MRLVGWLADHLHWHLLARILRGVGIASRVCQSMLLIVVALVLTCFAACSGHYIVDLLQ